MQQTSESLLRNQDDFRSQLIAEQTKSKAKDAQISDLTEQVCSLFKPVSPSVQPWQSMLHGICSTVKHMQMHNVTSRHR